MTTSAKELREKVIEAFEKKRKSDTGSDTPTAEAQDVDLPPPPKVDMPSGGGGEKKKEGASASRRRSICLETSESREVLCLPSSSLS